MMWTGDVTVLSVVALAAGLLSVFLLLSIVICDQRLGRWAVGLSLSCAVVFLTLSAVVVVRLG